MIRRVGLVLIVLVLSLAACGGAGDSASEGDVLRGEPGAAPAEPEVVDDEAALGAPAPAGDGDVAALPPVPQAQVGSGERVIKEGTITIEVGDGEFDRAFQRAVDATRRLGGTVTASSTNTSEDGSTFGTVTVRVPVTEYEQLLVDVAGIGTVRSRNITSQDVSTEFVDLESRLRHLQAQERFYLGLLEEAETVNDAIAVQQQLEGIQGQIEQIQGRLRFLEDRTSFSTLTIELLEPGTAPRVVDDPDAGPTLTQYWAIARDALVNVIGTLIVLVFFSAPIVTVALIVYLVFRLTRKSRGQGTDTATSN